MGLIRGGLFVLVSIILFISLLVGGIFLILSLSLSHDNVNKNVKQLIIGEEIIGSGYEKFVNESYIEMKEICKNMTSVELSNNLFNITYPCSVVNENLDSTIDFGYDLLIDEIYYKKYDCNLIDCMDDSKSGPFVLLSEQAKSYWTEKFLFSLIISLLLLAGLFFLAHKKNNFLIISGFIFILSGFILLNISAILIPMIIGSLNLTSNQLDSIGESLFESVIYLFFNQSSLVFYIYLVLGVILVLGGIILKLWRVSFGISKFFGIGKNDKTNKKIKELEKQIEEKDRDKKK